MSQRDVAQKATSANHANTTDYAYASHGDVIESAPAGAPADDVSVLYATPNKPKLRPKPKPPLTDADVTATADKTDVNQCDVDDVSALYAKPDKPRIKPKPRRPKPESNVVENSDAVEMQDNDLYGLED